MPSPACLARGLWLAGEGQEGVDARRGWRGGHLDIALEGAERTVGGASRGDNGDSSGTRRAGLTQRQATFIDEYLVDPERDVAAVRASKGTSPSPSTPPSGAAATRGSLRRSCRWLRSEARKPTEHRQSSPVVELEEC
jgi:hypothetical protein